MPNQEMFFSAPLIPIESHKFENSVHRPCPNWRVEVDGLSLDTLSVWPVMLSVARA